MGVTGEGSDAPAVPSIATPLLRDEILAVFEAVADKLPAEEQHSILIAGGAALVLQGLRGAQGVTGDVDAVQHMNVALREAARAVASERGLPDDWLNSKATAYLPADITRTVVYQRGGLLVESVSYDDLFLMKLDAGRERDMEDLVELWSRCSYVTAQAAVDDFNERVSMRGPEDPYLIEFVKEVAAESAKRVGGETAQSSES